jgi:hypothetical protein
VSALKAITGAQTITPQHQADVKLGYGLIGELRGNPRAFIENIAADLGLQIVDPKANGGAPAGAAPAKGELPKPDLLAEDGKTQVYSATAMMRIVEAKVQEAIEKVQSTINPLVESHQTARQQEQERQQRETARAQSQTFLSSMRERPHFKDHEPAILEKLKSMDPALRKELGPRAALQQAYLDVLNEVVYPTQEARTEQKVRDNFLKKANTRGSIAPNTAQPTGEKQRPRNQQELAKRLEEAMAP